MFDVVFGLLTGTGLAASAGLNAYIPLLVVGLLARYTELIELPGEWQWLAGGAALAILGGLLAVEFVADKVPAVDSVNDVLQTFVRPTSGGLAFGASSASTTVAVDNPDAFFATRQWVPLAIGAAIALVMHAVKAASRVALNTMTLGIGAPVASTVEDATSLSLSVVAIIIPVLVIFFLVGVAVLFGWLLRRRGRTRQERQARRQV